LLPGELLVEIGRKRVGRVPKNQPFGGMACFIKEKLRTTTIRAVSSKAIVLKIRLESEGVFKSWTVPKGLPDAVRGQLEQLRPFELESLRARLEALSTEENLGPNPGANLELLMKTFTERDAFGLVSSWTLNLTFLLQSRYHMFI
jgi:hypothetical protein